MPRRNPKQARTVRRNVQVVVTRSVRKENPDIDKVAKALILIALERAERGLPPVDRKESVSRDASDEDVAARARPLHGASGVSTPED